MAHLTYFINTSLDGYIEDIDGKLDWSEPDEEVHSYINNLVRAAGTYLYGRQMYETMMVWETDPSFSAGPPIYRDFAEIWQAAGKIVYSRNLEHAHTQKTRIERIFDPEAVRQLKAAAGQDILIGGPDLAAHAFRAGLIDTCQLLIHPIILGGGKPALPGNIRLALELLEEQRFPNSMVTLRYRVNQGSVV